jgi:hypothetical protein
MLGFEPTLAEKVAFLRDPNVGQLVEGLVSGPARGHRVS